MFDIKNKLLMMKFKRKSHKHFITPKGECYIQYIINKYINATKPNDNIEAYEEMINKNENRVRQIKEFNQYYIDNNGNEIYKMLHFIAANLALSLILMSLRENEVQKYLNMINNPEARKFINMLAHPNKTLKT